MANKNIAKSVRMTEEVYDIVNNREGNGFNEKFENLCLFFKKTEPSLRRRIAEKTDYINMLDDEINKKRELLQKLRIIENSVNNLLRICDTK